MRPTIRLAAPLLLAVAAMIGLLIAAPWQDARANPTPFSTLLGSWRGSGQILLDDGRRERLKWDAYYTGGGTQLGMAIRCQSESSNVEIRSKLSLSGNRLSGNWEERTYNASGSATGTASAGRINLYISGGVTGTMRVSYTRSRQSVAISTQGIALRSVSIDLTRS